MGLLGYHFLHFFFCVCDLLRDFHFHFDCVVNLMFHESPFFLSESVLEIHSVRLSYCRIASCSRCLLLLRKIQLLVVYCKDSVLIG